MTLTISRRLGLLVGLAAILCLAIVTIQILSLRDSLMQERRTGVLLQVQQAASIVTEFGQAAASGKITKEDAQQRAGDAIRAMQFGDGNTFFVYDFKGVSLVSRASPQFEGKARLDVKDADGKRYIAEMVDLAKTGPGFVSYNTPHRGSDISSPKISYIMPYAPWEWFIGTGVWIDDLDAIFWGRVKVAAAWSAGIILILIASAYYLARGLVRPIGTLTAGMGRLAEGDTDTMIAGQDRRDEVGAMARAVQIFKDNAVALRGADAEKLSLAGEADRVRARHDATQAAQSEAQGHVMSQVAERLALLAGGDLTARLAAFPSEYKRLETDFNAAVAQLQTTMVGISENTSSITGGASEISHAADDLARRTEQQAASLEQTAAALDEITATVRKTSEGADEASRAVKSATAEAQDSTDIVRDAISAMNGIAKSSTEISQIIGVIDEIAFQTNLLALNAGVEAARAGEAGRGFAVVAQEVRALAQRSAEAAKEIKGLISTSSSQVATGVDLVGRTGAALQRIVTQVAGINGIVTEIAASAREQATGLAEVNTAVNQMDQVTQQNAAMVEQSTAATHGLSGEATQLAALVGRFNLGNGAAARPSPRAQAARPQLRSSGGRGVSAQTKAAPASDWEEF